MSARPALLIDARNIMYRAIFATKNDRRYDVKYHYFVIFLRQLTSFIRIHDPVSVHVFWDAPRKTVWRRKLHPTYKDRDNNPNIEDISAELSSTTEVAMKFLEHMNVRQYSRDTMEADDLIYSAVEQLHPYPSVIVSTDSDMTQIPFRFSSSKVYHPHRKEDVETPTISPVLQKSLVGDKADSIVGYKGIGPKKSAKLLADLGELHKFLKANGRRTFGFNMLLIDLSLCPKLLANRLYIQKKFAEEVAFSSKEINDLTMKYKVNGMMQEGPNLVPPFKKLA